jgi:hypothetical protein
MIVLSESNLTTEQRSHSFSFPFFFKSSLYQLVFQQQLHISLLHLTLHLNSDVVSDYNLQSLLFLIFYDVFGIQGSGCGRITWDDGGRSQTYSA